MIVVYICNCSCKSEGARKSKCGRRRARKRKYLRGRCGKFQYISSFPLGAFVSAADCKCVGKCLFWVGPRAAARAPVTVAPFPSASYADCPHLTNDDFVVLKGTAVVCGSSTGTKAPAR